jgi:stage V sporulation protein S
MEILKVSTTSRPVAVAGAIAGVIRTSGRVEVQAIGAGAVNQAVKAIAVARGYVAPGGMELCCVPSFVEIHIEGELRTGIRLVVEVRDLPIPTGAEGRGEQAEAPADALVAGGVAGFPEADGDVVVW